MIELKAMPFDSNEILDPVTGETTFDRVAYSKDLADWMRTYFSNGVLVKGGNVLGTQLQVVHKEGLTITVKAGDVCISGRTGWLDMDTDETVSVGGASPRIDRVVAELNIPSDRGVYIKVIEGTPAAEPIAPELIQTEDVFQIPLAQIRVDSLSATIAEVVDERPDNISNVTIGIKPPTGMDAVTVKVSDATKSLYGGAANVDEALTASLSLSSYQAFCANTSATALDAAFGKNNEDRVLGVGLQLAMYAWFSDNNKLTAPFSALITKSKIADIFKDKAATIEVANNLTLKDLISASPFADVYFYKAPHTLRVLTELTGKTFTNVKAFIESSADVILAFGNRDKNCFKHTELLDSSNYKKTAVKVEGKYKVISTATGHARNKIEKMFQFNLTNFLAIISCEVAAADYNDSDPVRFATTTTYGQFYNRDTISNGFSLHTLSKDGVMVEIGPTTTGGSTVKVGNTYEDILVACSDGILVTYSTSQGYRTFKVDTNGIRGIFLGMASAGSITAVTVKALVADCS